MTDPNLMTAQEAAEELGVKVGTIYAYVSRGLIRSRAANVGQRNRLYSREDVTRLLVRRQIRLGREPSAENDLNWAAPVLETGISLIEGGRLYYCGIPIEEVAQRLTAEELAALVWTEDATNAVELFDHRRHPSASKIRGKLIDLGIDRGQWLSVATFQIVLPIAMADDLIAFDLRRESIALSGARILRLLTALGAGDVPEQLSLAEMLQRGWQPDDQGSIRLFNLAYIICADHQLKLATYAAWVAAALGTTPYSIVNTGITALAGPEQGGYTETVEVFLDEVKTPENAVDVICSRMRRSESFPVPGFNNPLYPAGDPRARLLLNALFEEYPDSPAIILARSIRDTVLRLRGEYPKMEFALAIFRRHYGLPPNSTLGIFALGRIIGWIGHAIRQQSSRQAIQPRFRYTGPAPQRQT